MTDNEKQKIVDQLRESISKAQEHYELYVPHATASFDGVYRLKANVYNNLNTQPVTIVQVPPNLTNEEELRSLFFRQGVDANIYIGGQFKLIDMQAKKPIRTSLLYYKKNILL